ncbi:MAG: 16S rRNA (uracil(1498)-N(3))-methyltransferase [Deltaproteobacteria bacterium]|nr:16S rRNA (uracil(1498)-N(3))-methyltransferase [Deltaproteobacteria bacterium]
MRIFVPPAQLAAGTLSITGDEHHYLSRVRRARTGDRLELVDGAGRRAAATIASISDSATTLTVSDPEAIASAPPFIRALIPWIKGDRMDVCIEKLVEAGCDEIVVWPAARAVVVLDSERRAGRIVKLASAVQAAARQCGRAQVPTVRAADSLSSALPAEGLRIVLDPTSDGVLEAGAAAEVTLISGPEGGFTNAELEQLAMCTSVGLGPRILRAETAPVIATAIIRAQTRS